MNFHPSLKKITSSLFLALLVLTLSGIPSRESFADCDDCCECDLCPPCCEKPKPQIMIQVAFDAYRVSFIMNIFYTTFWEGQGLKPMADEIRNAFATHGMMVGAFLDGTAANSSLATLQSLNASTMKDYAVSDTVCHFGSSVTSLAGSESKSNLHKMVLSEIALSRNLGTSKGSAAPGRGLDNISRLYSVAKRYCDKAGNNNGLSKVCIAGTQKSDTVTVETPRDIDADRDINYTRTIDARESLNIEFTNTNLNRDEEGVISLGNFLYGHRQDTDRMTLPNLRSPGRAARYALSRSIVARRAAAQNTYNTIAAMKGGGSESEYLKNIYGPHGMHVGTSTQITLNPVINMLMTSPIKWEESLKNRDTYLMGRESNNPLKPYDEEAPISYNVQMLALTKFLFEDSGFYADLMDTRSNVKRISTAMAATALAQDRDIFKSVARSEMLMALLLEMEARTQDDESSKKLNETIKQQ